MPAGFTMWYQNPERQARLNYPVFNRTVALGARAILNGFGPQDHVRSGITGMIKITAALAALTVALATLPAKAADDAPAHFICTFESGTSWSYDAGKFQSAPPAKLAFEIGSIDIDKQSADLIVDGRQSGKFRIVRALNANHYLEVANEGFLNLTTIYDLDPATGDYPAVHSRHFGILGQPVFAQYAGTCSAKTVK